MEDVQVFVCIVFGGEFQKIVWAEKEKLWTRTKENWSPKEKTRYKGSLRPMKKSTSKSYSLCVQIKQAFLCCYECSDFSLAGQLSGLGCGEFLLILAFLWPQWTVSTARETIPFEFHKADLVRSPPCVHGAGDPQRSQEGLCQPALEKQLQKTLKNPTRLSSQRDSQSFSPTGDQACFYYHIWHHSRRHRRQLCGYQKQFIGTKTSDEE